MTERGYIKPLKGPKQLSPEEQAEKDRLVKKAQRELDNMKYDALTQWWRCSNSYCPLNRESFLEVKASGLGLLFQCLACTRL